MDKRSNRVQPIRLSPDFFPLDIHKSMFINDLTITIPTSYVKVWGNKVIDSHDINNYTWDVHIDYESPKDQDRIKYNFKATLWLSFIKKRNKESSYRLKWDKTFAVQLAKDYPKSFVRSLEFHIGDEYYKEQKFTEYDIGGFKEQLQVKIDWKDSKPIVIIIQVSDWKPRKDLKKELNENNIYLLLNREKQEIYIGETKKTLAQRYPEGLDHHSFKNWTEYTIIQLPPETSDHSRLLIERILIAVGVKLFKNKISDKTPVLNLENGLTLMNKKK